MPARIQAQHILAAALVLVIIAAALPSAPLSAQSKAGPQGSKDADPYTGLSLGAFRLRSIGPALTSGRISDFAVRPGKRHEFFVASASGGVWKTVNAGTTFTPVFDTQGSYSIGCVTLDPNNPNVVWVGTGENNNQRSVGYGDGVYKSEDGGATWKHVGFKASEHIGMIAVDPRDSNVVYVAAYGPLWSSGGERGIYKTTNGGRTWSGILAVDDDTGISEIHMDPHNPDILYASAHQRRRHVFSYHLNDIPKSLRDQRKDEEAALVRAGKPVPYPTYERLRAEQAQEPAVLLFTIADEDGEVVRILREPARKGINRATWDLRYPGLVPTNPAQASPTSSGPSSTFVIPGNYTVSMAMSVDGNIKELSGPVAFNVRALTTLTLPAADRAELAAFQKKVRKLAHSVTAASSVLRDLNTLTRHYRASLKSVTVPHQDILDAVRTLETKIESLQLRVTGDRLLSRLDKDTMPGIASRIGRIAGEQYRSTSAPTQTQHDTFAIAEKEFGPVHDELKKILAEDVRAIEARLDGVGAPTTPGRLPDWK